MLKILAHPFKWISWTMCLVSSLSHSWGRFKFFSLSILRYFGLIMSCIWLCKDELCSKDDFFLCSDIYPIPAISVILWCVGKWGHIIFPSLSILFPWYVPTIKKSFTLTIIKAQEKIAQNTNNLSNLFHGQAQAEYYLVGPNIILMALYSINSLFPPFESWLHRTSILPHKQCFWYGEQDESYSYFILYWKMF